MFTFDTEVHFVSETCLVCWRLSVAQRHLLEDDDNTGRKAADQEVTATAEEGGVFTGETTDH